MNLIAAVDLNWTIGFNGDLLEKIPEDMQFFKDKTLGKVIVMGRKTLESLPGKKPLKDRINIILSKNKNFFCKEAIVCSSREELFKLLKPYKSEHIFICGGQEIYSELLPFCEYAYITKIFKEYRGDRFLINLDKNLNWSLIEEGETKQFNGLKFKFIVYKNKGYIRI